MGPSSVLRPEPVVLERVLVLVVVEGEMVEVLEGEMVDVVEGEVVVCEPDPDPPPAPEPPPVPAANARAAVPSTKVLARAIVRRCFIIYKPPLGHGPQGPTFRPSGPTRRGIFNVWLGHWFFVDM